ncbi:MAG: DUF1684 domain-containing protein [Myxococcaceae bacterium]
MVIALAVMTMVSATAALEAEEKKWHEERVAHLTAEDGWLTLVGLHWLEEGENPAGSDPASKVHLVAAAPAKLGTFVRKGKSVEFKPAVPVTLNGKPFSGGPLKTDAAGAPDVLRVGTLQLLVIDRGDRLGVRVRDSEADARKHFVGLERFPVSADWRKDARFELAPEGKKISIPNVLGQVSDEPLYGTAVFTHEGKEYRLLATKEDDELFFVFADPTNRKTTYGAGRFLYTELPKDGKLVLDFNRAFNPPCAFSAFATCPLPVKENRLPIPVEAGEKRYAGGH